jgi:tetrahydrodipicolinate N-succinyltransferase
MMYKPNILLKSDKSEDLDSEEFDMSKLREGGKQMTASTTLDHAEMRVDQAQAALQAVDRVLEAARKAESAAERAGAALRSGTVLFTAAAVAVGAFTLLVRRRDRQSDHG